AGTRSAPAFWPNRGMLQIASVRCQVAVAPGFGSRTTATARPRTPSSEGRTNDERVWRSPVLAYLQSCAGEYLTLTFSVSASASVSSPSFESATARRIGTLPDPNRACEPLNRALNSQCPLSASNRREAANEFP